MCLLKLFSLKRVVPYTVLIDFPFSKTLVKTLAINLVRKLTENLVKNLDVLFGPCKGFLKGPQIVFKSLQRAF